MTQCCLFRVSLVSVYDGSCVFPPRERLLCRLYNIGQNWILPYVTIDPARSIYYVLKTSKKEKELHQLLHTVKQVGFVTQVVSKEWLHV